LPFTVPVQYRHDDQNNHLNLVLELGNTIIIIIIFCDQISLESLNPGSGSVWDPLNEICVSISISTIAST